MNDNALVHLLTEHYPWIVPFLFCYVYAGLQTWRLMFLLDPQAKDCELDRAMRQGKSMSLVLCVFLLTWPLLNFAAWLVLQTEPTPKRASARRP